MTSHELARLLLLKLPDKSVKVIPISSNIETIVDCPEEIWITTKLLNFELFLKEGWDDQSGM